MNGWGNKTNSGEMPPCKLRVSCVLLITTKTRTAAVRAHACKVRRSARVVPATSPVLVTAGPPTPLQMPTWVKSH